MSERAWIRQSRSPEEATLESRLAITWTEKSGGARNGLLVAPDMHGVTDERLAAFARRHAQTSSRSRTDHRPSGNGPIICYRPDWKQLEIAAGWARNARLCVMEHQSWPISGWAAVVGATDLLTMEPTPPLDPGITNDLEFLVHWGNNAYSGSSDKKILDDWIGRLSSPAEYRTLLGATLALGLSTIGVDSIERRVRRVRSDFSRHAV